MLEFHRGGNSQAMQTILKHWKWQIVICFIFLSECRKKTSTGKFPPIRKKKKIPQTYTWVHWQILMQNSWTINKSNSRYLQIIIHDQVGFVLRSKGWCITSRDVITICHISKSNIRKNNLKRCCKIFDSNQYSFNFFLFRKVQTC